jgi:Dickkopf-like protein
MTIMKGLLAALLLAGALAATGCKDRTLATDIDEGGDCRYPSTEASSCAEGLYCDGSAHQRVAWMSTPYVRGTCSKLIVQGERCHSSAQCADGRHCTADGPDKPLTCQ